MTITEIFAGVEQCDVAALTVGGRTFRCFVWLSGPDDPGSAQRVEAKIFVDGEDGQLELVDAAVIATAVGDQVDCPRVLAVESRGLFVVHWIDYARAVEPDPADADLFRSIFDMSAIPSGWSSQGSVALYETLQYDHATVLGDDDGEFIVSRRTAIGTITTVRYLAPFSWADTVWSQADAGLTIAASVLAVHAEEANDDVVLVSYQDTLLLRTIRRNATDGGSQATSETFADLVDGDMRFTAVSHVRVGNDIYLVACEAAPDDEVAAGRVHARLVGFRIIEATSTAVQYESQWLYGWHLLSRLWTWASGVTGQVEAFALLGWKSIADGQEYDQMIGACVRFDVAALAGANAAGVVRPIPVSVLTAGSLDTRPHGASPSAGAIPSIGTRVNHLSHASGPPQYTLGPDRKAVLVATARWQRLIRGNEANELQPAAAAVGYYRHYHEDEWTVQRDEKEVAQPDTPAWRGANSRPMALPVETSTGLILAGGVTVAYDGQQPVELGFLHAPEITVSPVAMGGDMDDAETYYWFANYAWPDNRGAIHRGPPSRPVSTAVAAGGYATITCRCHNLGMKDDVTRYPLSVSRPIVIEVWRTTAPGGTFETEGPASAPLYIFRREYGSITSNFTIRDTPTSNPNALTVTFDVGRPNSEVSLNEIAPFQLDLTTLQWTPPPPITHQPLAVASVWQNRLFGVDPEVGLLRWSEEILPIGASPIWPEFLDTNTFRLDGVGDVTALQVMDDTLLVFSRDGVYALTGDPGAGGAGVSFRLQRLASGIGCVEPRSVVHYSEGVFFQSAKGIHRVTRGMTIDYPGAAIEDLIRAAGNVRGAVHLENRHQIRYSLQALPGTGPLVVRPRVAIYDYRVGLWSVRTLPMLAQSSTASRLNEHQHATAWRGLQGETLHVVLQQGGLAIERAASDTVYADINSASTSETVCLDVITEWFHPAGIVGQWLCDEIGIQTERVRPGPLTIQAWYNVDGLFAGTYDENTPHCTWTYAGTTAPAYIPFRLNALKVSWVKLRIFEPSSAPATENVRLVSLTLRWRHLTGPRRVAR